MTFDFEQWKHAVLASAQGEISASGLHEASGLISSSHLDEEAFENMLKMIEDEIAEEVRRADKASPDE